MDDVLSASIFRKIFDTTNDSEFFEYLDLVSVEQQEFFDSPVSSLVGATKASEQPWIFYSTDAMSDLLRLFTTRKQHRFISG